MKSIISLLALLCLSLFLVHAQDEEVFSTETNVVTLDNESFDSFIAEHAAVLVKFSDELCEDCKEMDSEWDAASLMLEEDEGKLVKVESAELLERFEIEELPAFKLFLDGELDGDFEGAADDAEFVAEYLQKMSAPAITDLDDEQHLKDLLEVEPLVVVLFGENTDEFNYIAQHLQDTHHFARVEAEVEDVEQGTIRAYREYGAEFVDFEFAPSNEEVKEDNEEGEEVKSAFDVMVDAMEDFVLNDAANEEYSYGYEKSDEESYEQSYDDEGSYEEGSYETEEDEESNETEEDEESNETEEAEGSYETEEDEESNETEGEGSYETEEEEGSYETEGSEGEDSDETEGSYEYSSEKENEEDVEEQNEEAENVEEQNEDEQVDVEVQNE